jgi:hypothetical protein
MYPGEDPARGCGVKEGHGSMKDATEDLLEKPVGGLEANEGHKKQPN